MKKKKSLNFDPKVRIRTDEELQVRRNEFLKICSILDKLKIRYFLQGGVLLGAIRHKGFIPWDWDAELSVFSSEVKEKADKLRDEIINSGFIIEKFSNELLNFKIDFLGKLPKDVNQYTIMGWSHDQKNKIFWRKTYKIPEHFLINMRKIKFLDRYHFAQYPPEKYLEYQYGNWKKPIQTKNKYIYMRKEYSGLKIKKRYINKIKHLIKSIIKKS